MTPLHARLCALVCDGHPATFRYTPPERRSYRQAAWDLIYTDAGGAARSVACCGCNDIRFNGEPDIELLAWAELRHLARKMREDAKKARKEQAKTQHKVDQLTGYAARCGAEADELEAKAAELEQP